MKLRQIYNEIKIINYNSLLDLFEPIALEIAKEWCYAGDIDDIEISNREYNKKDNYLIFNFSIPIDDDADMNIEWSLYEKAYSNLFNSFLKKIYTNEIPDPNEDWSEGEYENELKIYEEESYYAIDLNENYIKFFLK